MKTIRKVTALLAVWGLLLTLWLPTMVTVTAAATASPQKDLLYFGRSILEKMDNSKALCYAYDKLVDGLQRGESEIDVSHRTYEVNWEEAEIICELVRSDHPELYSVSSIGYTGSQSAISTFYGYYNAEAMSYANVVEHRVEQLTAGLAGKSDYEKSLVLHDRLCDAVIYEFGEHDQTVVGSLAQGTSVCAGYARGYQMLMQKLGIPCFYVVGYSRNQGHAWNLVRLDGEWYYTDVTWDDQNDTGDAGSGIYYSYLNVTYEQISEDHEASAFTEYLPKSTATANNYYIKNGLLLDPNKPVDVKKLAKAFKENYPPQLYYTGENVHEGAQLIFNNLQKIVKEMMGKTPYSGINASAGMLGNGIVIYLEVVHDHNYSTTSIPASCVVKGTKTSRCSDCGYTVKETLPATGHGQTVLWQDDTHHGYRCVDCGLTEGTEAHTFEQDGITCDGCGYMAKECHHRYAAVCDRFCDFCGEEQLIDVAHTYDDDKDADCNLCGEVREVITVIYGDASGDGKINNKDLGLLQQYLNDWAVQADLSACDVNGDGKINNKDLGLLQQYLNDWDVVLG